MLTFLEDLLNVVSVVRVSLQVHKRADLLSQLLASFFRNDSRLILGDGVLRESEMNRV